MEFLFEIVKILFVVAISFASIMFFIGGIKILLSDKRYL